MLAKNDGFYTISGVRFRNKADLMKAIQRILYAYPLGGTLRGPDAQLLHGLIAEHECAVEKIGAGIASIRVDAVTGYPNARGFWISRIDGSSTDVSFRKIIHPQTHRTAVTNALRDAVSKQSMEFFLTFWTRYDGFTDCPVTGEMMTPDDSDVDHTPPDTFVALVRQFLEDECLSIESVRLTSSSDNQIGRSLADELLVERWQAFHLSNARLRVVSTYANQKVIPSLVRTGSYD